MSLLDHYWDKIGWKGFEEMCMYLAESVFPERRFELYGQAGDAQDGIDIISKNETGEPIICVQCKHYLTMDIGDLNKVISEFEKNEFVHSARKFVLATKASLKGRKLVQHINAEKKRLEETYDIVFDTWDGSYIEKELANHYPLTCKYFGIAVADLLWSGKTVVPIAYKPVMDYIPRSIVPYNSNDNDAYMQWVLGSRKKTDFVQLLTGQLTGGKRYCLIADAYQGKTTLFEQLAYDLSRHPLKFIPVILKIKDYSDRSIADTLDITHNWWRSFSVKQLVVIIDGLDEVDSGRFLDTVKNVNELSIQYPSLPILFSCRKLFFNHEQVQTRLKDYSYYELFPLQEEQVHQYIFRRLLSEANLFIKHMEKYGLQHFLYHPFYLRSIVRIFKEDRKKLPKTRAGTVEYFIEESFSQQSERPISSGTILQRKKKAYKSNLKKMAFAMQLLGKNVLEDDERQTLFPEDDDIELLKQGSILSFSNEKWSFENAIFQEYLSALGLKNFSFEEIVSLVCIGEHIKKVRTKWIQTLVVLLSLLESGDERKQQLLQLLREDNIELLLLGDNQLLSSGDRIILMQHLLKRYEEQGIRPMVVQEDTIGRFFRGLPEALDILIKKLDNRSDVHIKRIIWRILQHIDIPVFRQDQILEIARHTISSSSDSSYVSDILYTLIEYQALDKKFVQFLVEQEQLNRQLKYRDRVYEIIVQANLGEEYYDYGLNGVEVMLNTPTDSYMRSERALESILLSARSRQNIEKLFDKITSYMWTNFSHHNFTEDESFISRLARLCEQLHQDDSLIVFSVIRFVKDLGRKHRRSYFKEIDQFFLNTKTSSFIVRYFIHMPEPYFEWELERLITADAFDFVFDYYENEYISAEVLMLLIDVVYYHGQHDLALELNALYVAATGKEDMYQVAQQKQRDREAHELTKQQNDLQYIQNQASFAKGLKKYFAAFGKRSIKATDFEVDSDVFRNSRKESDSYFIETFILWQFRNKKPVTLSHCLKAIANKDYFNQFRMYEILDYKFIKELGKEPLITLQQELYNERILQVDFKSAVKQTDVEYSISSEALLLQRVFEKMEFPTEDSILIDMLCMDMAGIHSFRKSSFESNKEPTLSERIITKLSPRQLDVAKSVILDRLQRGVLPESVMETHIGLCGYLTIYEAKDLILKLMLENQVRSYSIFYAVEVFLDLEGELDQLIPVLDAFDHYDEQAYYRLVLTLKDSCPQAVVPSLLKAIKEEKVSLSTRFDYAQLLMELGEKEGADFIVDQMEGTENLPWGRNDRFKLKKLETSYILGRLKSYAHFILEESSLVSIRKDIRSVIADFLFSLATKSESDLKLVDEFLKSAISDFSDKYTDLSMLHWYRERILEHFRDSDDGHTTLVEVKRMLSKLNDALL